MQEEKAPKRKEDEHRMILKGCQRKLIMVPTKSSPLFETAYFILRKETEEREPRPNEMLCEATRILEENSLTVSRRPLKRRHLAAAFGVGVLLGALILGVIWIAVA